MTPNEQAEIVLAMTDNQNCANNAQYTLTARVLHWATAVLVLLQIPGGLSIANFDMGPLYNLHKSAGVLILALVFIRLAWRWKHPAPALPDDITEVQRRAATIMHWALYGLLLIQTILGWVGTSAYPAPIPFFGLFELPKIWWEDRSLSNQLMVAHLWIGVLLALLLVGHIGAAFYHHFIRRDQILLRMSG